MLHFPEPRGEPTPHTHRHTCTLIKTYTYAPTCLLHRDTFVDVVWAQLARGVDTDCAAEVDSSLNCFRMVLRGVPVRVPVRFGGGWKGETQGLGVVTSHTSGRNECEGTTGTVLTCITRTFLEFTSNPFSNSGSCVVMPVGQRFVLHFSACTHPKANNIARAALHTSAPNDKLRTIENPLTTLPLQIILI